MSEDKKLYDGSCQCDFCLKYGPFKNLLHYQKCWADDILNILYDPEYKENSVKLQLPDRKMMIVKAEPSTPSEYGKRAKDGERIAIVDEVEERKDYISFRTVAVISDRDGYVDIKGKYKIAKVYNDGHCEYLTDGN